MLLVDPVLLFFSNSYIALIALPLCPPLAWVTSNPTKSGKKWFDCAQCHAASETHMLRQSVEMIFACKKCKKCFRKDTTDWDDSDEFCPHCDNHFVIDAKEPKAMLQVEGEDVRVDARYVTCACVLVFMAAWCLVSVGRGDSWPDFYGFLGNGWGSRCGSAVGLGDSGGSLKTLGMRNGELMMVRDF